ncbi:MAG TPA: metal ABC transporter substrate-binding protein [Thermoleophilaceae bacterium]|nr:metal ABC transporter substrate-binding protein [Thermoleophilaceae bacterium]
MRLLAALGFLAVVIAAGCGDGGSGGQGGKVEVVATTPVVADMARQVAGDRAEVHELLPRGADPHGYEPRPSDVRGLSRADLVVRSGGEIDDWLGDVLDSAGGDPRVVTLMDSVPQRIEGDPHWWQDPRNGIAAAGAIERALAAEDPRGRAGYAGRSRHYSDRLRRLDRSIAACVGRIPRPGRKLVTTHDALGYYARRYGLDVIGALIPSRSSRAQPSAREVERLVDQIERERVRTIFPESALSSRLERAIARESGAEVGGILYADTVGPDGSYLGSLRTNTEAIVAGLSGERCRP